MRSSRLQKTMAEGAGAAGLAGHAGRAGTISRPQGRPRPLRRQYRSAHPRVDHGARTRARGPHRLVPPDHSGSAREFSARSQAGSGSSAPISSASIITGFSSTFPPRAPSSTLPWRRATQRMPRRSFGACGGRLSAGAHAWRRAARLTRRALTRSRTAMAR